MINLVVDSFRERRSATSHDCSNSGTDSSLCARVQSESFEFLNEREGDRDQTNDCAGNRTDDDLSRWRISSDLHVEKAKGSRAKRDRGDHQGHASDQSCTAASARRLSASLDKAVKASARVSRSLLVKTWRFRHL